MRVLFVWAIALALTAGLSAQRPARTLPDREAFLREVRTHLQTNDDRQRDYSYVQTTRRVRLDGQGRPAGESMRVAESYPGLPGEPRWERVIEDDGRRTPEADLRKLDADRQKKAEAFARQLARQTEADRTRLARDQARRQADDAARVDDVFRVFDIAMLGREPVQGHDTIVFTLTPRPEATARTREGRWLRDFKGKAWVSESDFELVRLDVEAIRTVSIGMGLMARIHQGTRAIFERRKVNGEVWLPATSEYQVSGRVLLLKRIRESGRSDYSNYRKFSVDTSQAFTPAP